MITLDVYVSLSGVPSSLFSGGGGCKSHPDFTLLILSFDKDDTSNSGKKRGETRTTKEDAGVRRVTWGMRFCFRERFCFVVVFFSVSLMCVY